MCPTLTCLALALVGVDLGYRPAANGGTEFVIHISPATLQASRPGQPIDIDVPREARELRPSHFSITPDNEKLPGEVSVASLLPPATAPIGPASPVLPAAATSPGPEAYVPSGGAPVHIPPPSSVLPGQTGVRTGLPAMATSPGPSPYVPPGGAPVYIPPPSSVSPEQTGVRTGLSANSTSAESRFGGLPPVNTDGGNLAQPDRPWLAMCLFVIALLASNIYVGWLFLDARQRYRGLLTRGFSFGQQAAEA